MDLLKLVLSYITVLAGIPGAAIGYLGDVPIASLISGLSVILGLSFIAGL